MCFAKQGKRIQVGDDDVQQGKRIKVGDDDLEAGLACHDFLKEAPEDILLEVLIRLPGSRSAIRCAIVCHNWHSLISQNPQFIPRFISHHHQHQHRYPLPYAIMFRKFDKGMFAGPQYYQPICKLFSEEATFCTSHNFLDFMPSSPMVIRGSWNDLLLVSPGPRWSTEFYICNPITKQFIQLPEALRPPKPHAYRCCVIGHALICMPGPTNKFRFNVVEFQHPLLPSPGLEELPMVHQRINVFCSESRKWEVRHFYYPRARGEYYTKSSLHAITCNGILFWLEYERGCDRVYRVISLDLPNSQCSVIDFPDDSCVDPSYGREQIGVVRVCGGEELRLLQVVLTTGREWTVDLKVWKLSHNQDKKNWVLVHHKNKLEKPNRKKFQGQPFVHPTNGDVVFMVWEQDVFQYNLKDTTTTYGLIGKLQEPLLFTNNVQTMDRLLSIPVVQPNWPTQILAR